MRNSCVSFIFVALALVFGGALEELLPSFCGLGFPVLLGVALFFATAMGTPDWIVVAAAAGAVEDALSSQTPLVAVVFFVSVSLASRFLREPVVWICAAYPAYQVWVALAEDGSGVLSRLLPSVPVGALTLAATFGILARVRRKAGADA